MAVLPPAISAARRARFFEQRHNRQSPLRPSLPALPEYRVGNWQRVASAVKLAIDGERSANPNRRCPGGVGRIVRRQLTRTFAPHFAATRISTRDCFINDTRNRRSRSGETLVGARKSNCPCCLARD